jgi:HEAT repeat protein
MLFQPMKNTPLRALTLAFTLTTAAFLGTGCGGGAAKVDIASAVQRLKGTDKDAKINALVELQLAKEAAFPALDTLIETLQDPDPNVQGNAVVAIGEIGPKAIKAVPALKKVMDSSQRENVTSAINAIRAIDPKALPKDATVPNVQ